MKRKSLKATKKLQYVAPEVVKVEKVAAYFSTEAC